MLDTALFKDIVKAELHLNCMMWFLLMKPYKWNFK